MPRRIQRPLLIALAAVSLGAHAESGLRVNPEATRISSDQRRDVRGVAGGADAVEVARGSTVAMIDVVVWTKVASPRG